MVEVNVTKPGSPSLSRSEVLSLIDQLSISIPDALFDPVSELGIAALVALSQIIDLADDKEEGVREAAVGALGRFGPYVPKAAIPVLSNALNDSSSKVREQAINSLQLMDFAAVSALPALIKALGDTDSRMRVGAVVALGAIKPSASPMSFKALLYAVERDADPDVRWAAAQRVERVIIEHRVELEIVLPTLIGALFDSHERVRSAVAAALGQLGRGATNALPKLMELFNSESHRRDPHVALAVWRIARFKEAIPALIGVLDEVRDRNLESVTHEQRNKVLEAIEALGGIGPDATEAVPRLEKIKDSIHRQYPDRWFYYKDTVIPALVKIKTKLHELVKISPSIWPDKHLQMQPGDLIRFWDRTSDCWPDVTAPQTDPFREVTMKTHAGNRIYFDGDVTDADVGALLRLMKVLAHERQYAVFVAYAYSPKTSGYLTQLRIVHKAGLRYFFDALTDAEYDLFPAQTLTIGELACKFLESQRQDWGPHMDTGALDDDLRKQKLGFGFLVEDVNCGVYRIWSRV